MKFWKTFSGVFLALWLIAAIGLLITGGKKLLLSYAVSTPFAMAVLALVIVGLIYWIKEDKPFAWLTGKKTLNDKADPPRY